MESSSRMRRCLRRNYRGSDHFGAAANYEDSTELKHDNVMSPSKASMLAAEAISMEVMNEDDEQDDTANLGVSVPDTEQSGGTETRISETAEQPMRTSVESRDVPVTSGQDLAENPSVVAPGYVPSEHDERIVIELPSSMVRPLKILRGTFQVSSTSYSGSFWPIAYEFLDEPFQLIQWVVGLTAVS